MNQKHTLTFKQKCYLPIKRLIDLVLSVCGLIVLSPLLIAIVIAIKLDSKGPVIFKQKRVGKNKTYFNIWKFRTMRTDAPKDMPTHLLSSPDAYVVGKMSIIGPRPALWNQYDLIEERDKYGANDITPGLTGWAQVNGRDELEIPVKAKLDGEYVEKMGFMMDCKCFIMTIFSVARHDGVVEGGTGTLKDKSK